MFYHKITMYCNGQQPPEIGYHSNDSRTWLKILNMLKIFGLQKS